jgi:hypothetical protein
MLVYKSECIENISILFNDLASIWSVLAISYTQYQWRT